jgi:hypothetical protein
MQMPGFARSARLLLVASWSCAAASIAHAQSDSVAGHHGPQVGLSIGAGLKPSPCAGCVGWGEPVVGPTLMLRLGWAVSPRVVLSADLSAWGRSLDNTGEATTWQMITAQFYPDPRGGLYFNAGVGRAVDATVVRTTLAYPTVTTHTLGLSAGIGFDAHVSYSLSPTLDIQYAVPQWTGDRFTGPVRAGATVVRVGFTSVWRHARGQAEDDDGHHGFHIAFEFAPARVVGRCASCAGETGSNDGASFMLRMGGAVSPNLILSGEFDPYGGNDEWVTWEMLTAQYYLSRTKGLYVSAGAGLAQVQPMYERANNTLGLTTGVGYDLHISELFSLTPSVEMLYAAPYSQYAGGPRGGQSVLRAGVAFAWR